MSAPEDPHGDPSFPQTSWSLVQHCQDPAATVFQQSLDRLFRRYWQPVYFYIHRNWTRDTESAKDLTQQFFLKLLERDLLQSVAAERGRFRNFVLVVLRNMLTNHARDQKALKRRPAGGLASLDGLREQDRRFDVPAATDRPDAQFDRDWKATVLTWVLRGLRTLGAAEGKQLYVETFERLDLRPSSGTRPTYRELADELGVSYHQLNNGLHWARREFRRLLKLELEDQSLSSADAEAEAQALFGARLDG